MVMQSTLQTSAQEEPLVDPRNANINCVSPSYSTLIKYEVESFNRHNQLLSSYVGRWCL